MCPQFDWKAFVLDEASASERAAMEAHVRQCASCQAEAEGLGLTLRALRRLPEQDVPRRIAFVSDPVFEPKWWQRIWRSGPAMAFASASMLSIAILAHGIVSRPASAPAVTPAAVDAQVQRELAKQVPAAVREALQAEVKPALAEFSSRLDLVENTRLARFEQQVEQQRRTDLRDVKSAFDVLEKRLNSVYVSVAKYGGD